MTQPTEKTKCHFKSSDSRTTYENSYKEFDPIRSWIRSHHWNPIPLDCGPSKKFTANTFLQRANCLRWAVAREQMTKPGRSCKRLMWDECQSISEVVHRNQGEGEAHSGIFNTPAAKNTAALHIISSKRVYCVCVCVYCWCSTYRCSHFCRRFWSQSSTTR